MAVSWVLFWIKKLCSWYLILTLCQDQSKTEQVESYGDLICILDCGTFCDMGLLVCDMLHKHFVMKFSTETQALYAHMNNKNE
jgi:hypothetical protein